MLPTAADVVSRIRVANRHPETVSQDDLRVLGGALLLCLRDDDNGITTAYAELSNGGDLQQELTESVANLPFSPTNPTIDPLLVAFKRDEQFYEAMHALIAMTIPELKSETIDVAEIGPMQIEVLTRLAATDSIWECDMTLHDRLAVRGLPVSRHQLNRMLASIG